MSQGVQETQKRVVPAARLQELMEINHRIQAGNVGLRRLLQEARDEEENYDTNCNPRMRPWKSGNIAMWRYKEILSFHIIFMMMNSSLLKNILHALDPNY